MPRGIYIQRLPYIVSNRGWPQIKNTSKRKT